MKKEAAAILGLLSAVMYAQPDGPKMADAVLKRWAPGVTAAGESPAQSAKWRYEEGILLDGMAAQWRITGDGRYFKYIKDSVDTFLDKDGAIKGYQIDAHSLDNIEMGRSVLLLYRVTQDKKYYIAAKFLREQLAAQPRNTSGGYWHKQIYPNQMWLDGAYMAEPFLAGYAVTFQEPGALDETAKQLLLMDAKMRSSKTGLLIHGWDETRAMPWSDKRTGLSPESWGRAMGWYAMALVDVLEWLPANHPQRAALVEDLRKTAAAIAKYQDTKTGVWWDVLDKGGQAGNYPEASASCMFVYAIAKGVRMGWLPQMYERTATRGWAGIEKEFVKTAPDAMFTLTGVVAVSGLGGKPYRSGTYDYYIHEKVVSDDPKGTGAYLMAAAEMQQAKTQAIGQGKTVLLDAWWNSQVRKNAAGEEESYHYKWSDDANSGYSLLGRMFASYGMKLATLDHAPRPSDLEKAQIYVIASPDIPARNPAPHYMDAASAGVIAEWVKAGGVLVMMHNDSGNAEFEHYNMLSEKFGIHFNPVLRNTVEGTKFEQGVVKIPSGAGGIFTATHRAYMKEVCTLTLSGPAKAVITDKGDALMAVSHYGKGLVYANTDVWLYNEYTDGRKLPGEYDNYAAGEELVKWLVAATK